MLRYAVKNNNNHNKQNWTKTHIIRIRMRSTFAFITFFLFTFDDLMFRDNLPDIEELNIS